MKIRTEDGQSQRFNLSPLARNKKLKTLFFQVNINQHETRQYIFKMTKLTKKFGTKTILNDIWLAFYPAPKSACSAATVPAKAPF